MTERFNVTLIDEQAIFVHANSGDGSKFVMPTEATDESFNFHMSMLESLEQTVNGGGTTVDEMEKKLLSDL